MRIALFSFILGCLIVSRKTTSPTVPKRPCYGNNSRFHVVVIPLITTSDIPSLFICPLYIPLFFFSLSPPFASYSQGPELAAQKYTPFLSFRRPYCMGGSCRNKRITLGIVGSVGPHKRAETEIKYLAVYWHFTNAGHPKTVVLGKFPLKPERK